MIRCDMKIGLFGGSFDPVHQGHSQLAEQALRQFDLDRVIWIPAYFSPFKSESTMIASAEQRMAMVRLVCADFPRFEVSDFEIRRKVPSYAIDTVLHMRLIYPQAQLYWILGQDAFEGLPNWRDFQTLCRELIFLVSLRENGSCDTAGFAGRAELIKMPLHPAASSHLKESLSAGKGWDFLHEGVQKYVRGNQLYGVKE